ncbi:MAG: hypothetical protein IPN76_13525 [Saprospiraceae bacterium]|nr:hypothetical protein [Saprospiraceae bacterium]
MKQIAAISLAVLVFAVSAKDVLIWSSFKLNQDFIAKTLCINRDKPEKKCNGKCQLTKKIAESKEESPQQAPVPQPDEQKQVLSLHEILPLQIISAKPRDSKPLFAALTFTAQACAIDIFQPPRV